MEVKTQETPAIGGAEYRNSIGISPTSSVVASVHLGDAMRAEGVAYPENPGVDVTTDAYPQGTVMTDSSPQDDVN